MKAFRRCLGSFFMLAAAVAYALPPMQHSLHGIVRAIDLEKHTMTLDSTGKDNPTEFQIQDGRTRLKRDGKPAALAALTAGQPVHLYYKKEKGLFVATEVTWTSSAEREKPPPRQ